MVDVSARGRLSCVLAAAAIPDRDEAELLPSYSNDTWRVGDHIVRICWRGDTSRLRREAAVCSHLPPEIRYPKVVAVGHTEVLSWMVTARVQGEQLDRVWPLLDGRRRRRAIAQVADIVRTLHSWRPPEPVAGLLRDHAAVRTTDPRTLVGMDICPMPVERARVLAEAARLSPARWCTNWTLE